MIIRNFFLSIVGVSLYLCGAYALQFCKQLPSFTSDKDPVELRQNNDSNTIQVALLLDTSSSMSGLIEQAKSQLWNILNQLARTEKDGEDSTLEIALYEYGNPGKATDKYQINQLIPFTTDMDLVSEKLFSLRTGGGDEFCGAIINTSFEDLSWIEGDGLKMVYIAGNEGFDQGPIDFTKACHQALESGITINTIYCGPKETGVKERWLAGALAGGGEYFNIDHNRATVYVPTPYDDQIKDLNIKLNNTYIPYGKKGRKKKENQKMQDSNASIYSSANMVDRATFKSSKKYKATDWDLVDAYKKDKEILNSAEIVTDSLQNLSIDELESKIEAVAAERAQIQSQIQDLDKKRRKYKSENAEKNQDSSLQNSMIETIRKQATKSGYVVKE